MKIGSRIREFRKARGMSQKQLAKLSGLAQPTISDLERGRNTGSRELDQIAAALGVAPAALRSSTPSATLPPIEAAPIEAPLQPDQRALLDDWNTLPAGLRYYLSRKARELRRAVDSTPEFLRESLRTIPEESNYWRWEKNLDAFVKKELGIIEDDGYIGPERRTQEAATPSERRKGYTLPAPRSDAPATAEAKKRKVK